MMNRLSLTASFWLVLVLISGPLRGAEEPDAFFGKYCLRCHNGQEQAGEFRLDTLSRDFTLENIAQRWGEVMFRINSGEMPPEDEVQPSAAEVGEAVGWISARIDEGRAARMARRGPVTLYRLSRDEYANTVYDLLGVHYDVRMPGRFNEEPRWHGFNRLGSMLSLSPSHVTRYFSAAESVVSEAFPAREPKLLESRQVANDDRAQKWLEEHDVDGPVRWLLFPGRRQGRIRAREPGLYRIRVQLSALPSFRGRVPHLAVWNGKLKEAVTGVDVLASEEEPKVVEIETFLPRGNFRIMNQAPGMPDDGHNLSQTRVPFVSTQEKRFFKPTGFKLYDDQGRPIFPLLIVDWVEFEGPIVTPADREKREGLYPAREEDTAAARECLARFMRRAWRRPVSGSEVDRFMNVMQSELDAGESFRSAYQAALTGVLTAKNFYYLEEGSAEKRRSKVNDWELASRLSYFLWSSMPDEELFAAARNGTLHEPEVLKVQLQRMLADGKIERFTNAFPRQWLQLHRVGMFPPDDELYPDYDPWLEESMILETTRFFGEVFEEDLSLREFLTSDWTMMNARLAMHYALPLPEKTGFQRVSLGPDDHRGGLLTQASVLSLTSDGTRHRPVHRGVWVSEAVFGKTPPPPPPNVEPLEPTPADEPKATIRMQLEAHATHSVCASCHRKIDPLGFAFDNYDAIGRWRTEEAVAGGQGDNPPVNASGELPDGGSYEGPVEFKELLAGDMDRFARAFIEQLATFALRRVMTIDDADQIDAIAEASRQDGYRLRAVLDDLVLSDLFQKR